MIWWFIAGVIVGFTCCAYGWYSKETRIVAEGRLEYLGKIYKVEEIK